MGVCQTLLPILSNPLTYIGLTGLGIGTRILYSYSSYSFWPSFLAMSTIIRLLGSLASIINLAWRKGLFSFLALYTTFSQTINLGLTGKPTVMKLVTKAFTEFYDKIVLTVKHLVNSLDLLGQWLAKSQGELCSLVSHNEVLLSGLIELWVAAAAYIFALRFYDWTFGKGMTREVDWPETMMVILTVTFVSTTVYGAGLLVTGSEELKQLFELFQGVEPVDSVGNSSTTK